MIGKRTTTALLAAGAWLAWRNRPGSDLAGCVALVTGGSRGLGFLLAEALLAEGCSVAICGRDPETLERARAELRRGAGDGAEVLAVPCDIASPDDVAELVAKVVATYGQLDILVNNAATIQVAPLEWMRLEDFQEAMAIGFWGTVHATLAALPHLRRTGGRIANITSIGGKVAIPHLLPYDCAKFAAVGFSEGLRSELSGSGVSVTTVVPGLMRTGSPVHVRYGGNAPAEYAWFAAGDVTPVTAISARRVAAATVSALRRRDAEIVLSWQAKLLRVAHAAAPGTMARVLGLVSRLLPTASAGAGAAPVTEGESAEARTGREGRWTRGRELRGSMPAPLEKALDRAG
ncbi:MAG: SDR family oxidoreductase, partial [Gemmatimonadetes bacterium]|nr:SDR family oxidoreductase [Gemmatimonadota bacterium]